MWGIMKHYTTKSQAIYHEPRIMEKLKLNIDLHETRFKYSPKRMIVPKTIITEYLNALSAFQQILYNGKDVFTRKYPMYRGVELIKETS